MLEETKNMNLKLEITLLENIALRAQMKNYD